MATGLQSAHNNVLGEALKLGLQSFVPQYPNAASAPSLTATTSTGTPATGKFYSSIVNRASIPDFTQDLRASMGIDRIITPTIYEIQTEWGSNGEKIWGTLNDDRGLIRFVGNWTSSAGSNNGNILFNTNIGADYIEVTFYGTGLNLLNNMSANANRSLVVSVDGGAEGSNIIPTPSTLSAILGSRNYASNTVVPVVSGLTLGTHTVKIRDAGTAAAFAVYGFEILNASSTINVNPGIAYIDLNKTTLSLAQSVAYNSTFESGTLGTRGGRVLLYLKQDGTVAKALQPTNTAQANLASADHTNEEIMRSYSYREFGAGRTDDFSADASGSITKAFTIDDGTTTLVIGGGTNQAISAANNVGIDGSGSFLTFTFVGTGLDIVRGPITGTTGTNTISIDGTSIGTLGTSAVANQRQTIVSGLPYGTHTLKVLMGSAGGAYFSIARFVVYQPKKPSLPSGAVELADFNIVANYSALNAIGVDATSTGIIRKMATREFLYSGTWSASISATNLGGWVLASTTTGDYVQYTFFGTGFDYRFYTTATSTTFQFTVDGSTALNGFTTSSFGSGISSFTASTGTVVTSTTGVSGNVVSVSGLTLGLHTIKIAKTAGTGQFGPEAIDIITPIHSIRSSTYADLQNTLTIGSCTLSDNRKTTIVRDVLPSQKAWAKAIGVSANPSTSVNGYVPVPDMSVTIKTNGGALDISAQISVFQSVNSADKVLALYVDGVQQTPTSADMVEVNAGDRPWTHIRDIVPVSAGVHKVELYWNSTGSGTMTAQSTQRSLIVREI